MTAANLNSTLLNLAILNSAMLVFPLKVTLAKIGSHHFHKKNFTHSFWINLTMTAILNSAMLDSDTAILDSDTLVIFSQIHSKTLSLHSDSDSN